MLHRSPIELLLIPLAVGLGVTAALSPSVGGGLVMLCGLVALGSVIMWQPRKALACTFFVVMLAETKFHMGAPGALFIGAVERQMLLECFLYSVIGLVVVLHFFSRAYPPLPLTGVEWALFGYVLLALLSSLWAAEVRITVARSAQLCTLYALCCVSLRVLGPQHLLRLLATSTVAYVLLLTFLAVAFPWTDGTPFTQTPHMPRFTWFALPPMTIAAYAGTAALWLATAGLFAPGAWRRQCLGLPLWLVFIPLALVLLATGARGAILAFLVTLMVLCCRRYVNLWIVGWLSYGLLVLCALSLGLGMASPMSVQTILRLEEFLGLSGYTALWQHVYALALEHPLLGHGYLASRSMLRGLAWAGAAYNALAVSLLDVGIIGTALVWFPLMRAFLLSLLGTLRISGTGGWQHASVFGALLFLVLHSLVDATYAGTPGYHVLLLFATVCAHSRLAQELESGVDPMTAGAWRWSSAPPRLREVLLAWAYVKRGVAPAQKTS